MDPSHPGSGETLDSPRYEIRYMTSVTRVLSGRWYCKCLCTTGGNLAAFGIQCQDKAEAFLLVWKQRCGPVASSLERSGKDSHMQLLLITTKECERERRATQSCMCVFWSGERELKMLNRLSSFACLPPLLSSTHSATGNAALL